METEDHLLRIAQLEQMLEAKNIQLKQITQELDDLSFAVSHDLKAPIRAIAGFTAILTEEAGDLTGESKRLIGIIEKNAQKLSAMLNEIISYSSISKKSTVPRQLNMQQLASDAAKIVLPVQEQGNFSINVNNLLPCIADETMMKQLWINLLAICLLYAERNAFKVLDVTSECKDGVINYTAAVSNTLQAESNAATGTVQNSPLHRESVEENGTAASYIKRVIFKHQGSFWISVLPGHGCTFNFCLPI